MTLEQVKTMLESTGLPVAYRAFPAPQELPFICYLTDGDDNFSADGSVYFSAHAIRIELYTRYKDTASEALVETALSGLFYTKSETYIETEKCFEIIYELEV